MSYTKQNWNNQDPSTPISATRLNHLETQYDEALQEATLQAKGLKTGIFSDALRATFQPKGDGRTLDFTKYGILPVVAYSPVAGWPTRANLIPSGYTGVVRYDSTGYIGAPSPTDMISGDKWDRQVS